MAERLGVTYPAKFSVPLVEALRVVYYLRLFLDQILLVIEIFLTALGMGIIYALLVAEVDAKVYECGMLRALGMAQFTLIELLAIQSLLFSLPGLLLGLFAAWVAFIPLAQFFTGYTAVSVAWALTPRALLMGFLVGFTMPFIALIGPIQVPPLPPHPPSYLLSALFPSPSATPWTCITPCQRILLVRPPSLPLSPPPQLPLLTWLTLASPPCRPP